MGLNSKLLSCVVALIALVSSCAYADKVTFFVSDRDGAPLENAIISFNIPGTIDVRTVKSHVIAQKDKQFIPTVTAIHKNDLVEFTNQDEVRHHIYSFSPAKTFEIKLYSGQPSEAITFEKPGIVVIGCNIYDPMLAYVYVSAAQRLGKTDNEGLVSMEVGSATQIDRLKVWHPSLGQSLERTYRNVEIHRNREVAVALDM